MSTADEEISEVPVCWKILVNTPMGYLYYKRFAKTEDEAKDILQKQFVEWKEKYDMPQSQIVSVKKDEAISP